MEENQINSEILAAWDFPEYENYQRGKIWYLAAGVVFILLIISSIYTANFLFAVIIVLGIIIFYLQQHNAATNVEFTINPDGIWLGQKLSNYKEIRNFYIIYEPPHVKKLYFIFKSALKPRLAIPLLDQDPAAIRKILVEHLEEDLDKENEPLTDGLSRFLKL